MGTKVEHRRPYFACQRLMPSPAIPVHHLADHGRSTVGVEHILPREHAVDNDVHRHDFHELFLFATGTGEHMIDLQHIGVEPPCIHLVAPGQVHQLQRSADSSGTVVMFGADALMGPELPSDVRGLFRLGDARPSFALSPAMLDEARMLIGLIEAELTRDDATAPAVVRNYLGVLLLKCGHWRAVTDPVQREGSDASDVVARFTGLVEQGFLEKRQVNAYASELNVSPGHLNELVRKRLGTSASEVIQERVLLEAKRLLLHADLSVKEVSHALRMDDPAYFNRMFKKATGMTPVEYRAHIREKYKR
jgi:AraC family transcriptional activator of pobA